MKIKGGLTECAIKCIMVGYARNHSGDRYHMYNPGTKVEFIGYQMTAEQVTKN